MLPILFCILFATQWPNIAESLNASDILPCVLKPIAEIHCSGDDITDAVFRTVATKLGPSELSLLSISQTQLTGIHARILADVIIERIVIENNDKLLTIDAQAFKQSPAVKSVTIRNNPNLADSNGTFAAIRALNPSEGIILIGNGLREVPANALAVPQTESRLQYIYIGNNNIESVGANAFIGHKNLAYLELDNNLITRLDAAALNLTQTVSGPHPGLIYILLSANNLTSASFTAGVFGDQRNAILLDLEFNAFTDFPEATFGPFLSRKGSQIYLYENRIVCNCALKWTLARVADGSVQGLYCQNLAKSIEGLTERDIGCPAS